MHESLPGYDRWRLAEPPSHVEDYQEHYVILEVELDLQLDANFAEPQAEYIAEQVANLLQNARPRFDFVSVRLKKVGLS